MRAALCAAEAVALRTGGTEDARNGYDRGDRAGELGLLTAVEVMVPRKSAVIALAAAILAVSATHVPAEGPPVTTDEILSDWGFDSDEIGRLHDVGAVK